MTLWRALGATFSPAVSPVVYDPLLGQQFARISLNRFDSTAAISKGSKLFKVVSLRYSSTSYKPSPDKTSIISISYL